MNLPPQLLKASSQSRRDFLLGSAGSLLGVSAVGSLPFSTTKLSAEDGGLAPRSRPAKRVISLFMKGGMSQIETFTPLPDAPASILGEAESIRSNADGLLLGSQMPKMSKLMHLAVPIRSLHSDQGAHAQGRYFMKTNWRMRGTIRHPHLGSWTGRLAPPLNEELPSFVAVTGSTLEVGAGFLGAKHEPLVVRDPEGGLSNTRLARNDSAEAMQHRLDLAGKIDRQFRQNYASVPVQDHAAMFEATTRLLASKDLDAFDISQEPASRRKAYGSSRFGLGCLLARRLSASGVRFVEVELGGWDTHIDHFKRMDGLVSPLDTGLSALLADLDASGELEETLVVVTTEFGRTPIINQNEGRDHYPQAFTALIAGGGIQGGQAFGEVSKDGMEITATPTTVTAFNATVGWALGLPIHDTIYSPSKRPFTLANEAKPLTQLFGA